MSGRNKRSVWTVTTHGFKEAHFATFPVKLIEPCILAATSERGVCSKCGAPWVWVVEREKIATRPGNTSKYGERDNQWRCSEKSDFHERRLTISETIGWHPSCTCDAGEPIPATVLDTFGGAGTTGLVALQHGRKYIGIDLKQEYLDMTRARLDKAQLTMVTV